MKRTICVVILTAITACAAVGANSLSVGKASLSGAVLDWDGSKIVAKGKAVLTTNNSQPLKPGNMRLESINAEIITIELTRSGNDQTLRQASAVGSVIIRGKRADQETDSAGKIITVVRNVTATAKNAVMSADQDTIKLSGNAVVKILDPGADKPVAYLTGEIVTVSLKDNRIRVEGQSRPAEFAVTSGEGERK